MRQIKDVLRLKLELHHSQRHIAAALGLSKGVVAKYIKLASDAGLYWPQIERMRSINPAPYFEGSDVIDGGRVCAVAQPGGSAMFQGSSAS